MWVVINIVLADPEVEMNTVGKGTRMASMAQNEEVRGNNE